MSNNDAQKQVLALLDDFEFEPTSLITYQSAGKVIAVGDDNALMECSDLPDSLDIGLISTASGRIQIDGYLGAYVVEVTDPQGNQVQHQGDAILDLNETPLLGREMLPPGYFHVPARDFDNPELVTELLELQGEFQKPRYFDYDASICAHGVNGKLACRQCLDACPAAAI